MHTHLKHNQSPAWSTQENYAALDLGTNNCRLLIARPTGAGFRVIDAFSRIVRLGEGLALTNRLSENAINRSIEALKICRDKIERIGAERVRLVATEACRTAQNGSFFLERVRAEVGFDLEIITRETEARLAVAGCAALADPNAGSVIVFDIGGGSTEIIWLTQAKTQAQSINARVKEWVSLPVGVVTLADRYGGIEVSKECFERMVDEVLLHMADFAQAAASAVHAPSFHILGTSGTVTTLAGVYLGLERYNRKQIDGIWMGNHDVSQVMQQLLGMSFEQRAANPCIGSERADLVLAGCAIFEAIRRAFPSQRVRIADRGLREGILMQMMQADGVWHNQENIT